MRVREASEHTLAVDDLFKRYELRRGLGFGRARSVIKAVDGISFSVEPGETFSLVGESGCGKSTTARIALGLEVPSEGRALFKGRPISDLTRDEFRHYRRNVQAVFQDPGAALNPRRRIGANIAEPLRSFTKLSRAQLRDAVDDLLAAVGLPDGVATSFPHELSGGMKQRAAVAQAVALNPDLIVLDEPVSALDVSIRAQVINLLQDLQKQHVISYLLIAHDLATVRHLSHEVGAMYLGRLVERAPVEQVFAKPGHPYTIALMSAASGGAAPGVGERIFLRGDAASAGAVPSGCRFHPRCWLRERLGDPEVCEREDPALLPVAGPAHFTACHFADDLLGDRRLPLISDAGRRSQSQIWNATRAQRPAGPGAGARGRAGVPAEAAEG